MTKSREAALDAAARLAAAPVMGRDPIPTVYRGVTFRSRLEARWAVFWDALEVPWLYEPEPLSVNGRLYLPDFFLPSAHGLGSSSRGLYVEIKPRELSAAERSFFEGASDLADRLLVLNGSCWPHQHGAFLVDAHGGHSFDSSHWDEDAFFGQCRRCGRPWLVSLDFWWALWGCKPDCTNFGDKMPVEPVTAYVVARAARFWVGS